MHLWHCEHYPGRVIGSAVVELNRRTGTTVLLTTHDLADVERLCERLLIIDRGHVIEDTTVADIRDRYGDTRTLVVDMMEPMPPVDVPGADVVRVEGPRQWVRFNRAEHSAASVLAAVTRAGAVRDLALEKPTIDEIVGRIYRRDVA